MEIRYFSKDDAFIAVTDISPKGFKGVVLIGKGPTTEGDITTVTEQAFAIETLKRLKVVPKHDVPDEWLEAFGYEAPDPKPQPVVEEIEDEVLILDESGENFVAAVPFISRRVRQPAPTPDEQADRRFYHNVGLIIGLVIMGLVFLFSSI